MEPKPLKRIPNMFRNWFFKSLITSYPNYQPIFRNNSYLTGSDRACSDRWDLIAKKIAAAPSVHSLVDFGCAEGYYVLRSAQEAGLISLGIDMDVRRLSVAYLQATSGEISHAGFMKASIDPDLVKKLPKYDVTLFLSVLHHMMYMHGESYCREMLIQIREKTDKFMIFEMGQSNETENHWATDLPDMGKDPHAWIQEFILSAGFSSVKKIGESPGYKKEQNRAIFWAIP